MAFATGASCRLKTRPVRVRESAWLPRCACAGSISAARLAITVSAGTIIRCSFLISRPLLCQMEANILADLPFHMNPSFTSEFLLFRFLGLAVFADRRVFGLTLNQIIRGRRRDTLGEFTSVIGYEFP